MCLFLALFFSSIFCIAQQEATPLLFVLRASDIEVYACDKFNHKNLCTYDQMQLLARISLSERGLSVQKIMPLRLSSSVAVLQTKRGAYEKYFNLDWWRILGQDDNTRKELYLPKTRVHTLKRINTLIVYKNRYVDDVYIVEIPQDIKSAFIVCVPHYVVTKIQKVIVFIKNELIALGLLTATQSPELDTSSLPQSIIDVVDEVIPEEQMFSVMNYMYVCLESLRRKIENLIAVLW
jgi:hypothetical protein